MANTKLRTEYVEVDLAAVLGFFADAYEFKEGTELFKAESFIDPVKGKVIFKLVLEEPK